MGNTTRNWNMQPWSVDLSDSGYILGPKYFEIHGFYADFTKIVACFYKKIHMSQNFS
jgi:hypothetical protein